MTNKQHIALLSFMSTLAEVRGLKPAYETEDSDGKLLVSLDLPDFPTVSIGRQGGYGMPGISSYPETGAGDSYRYPGTSALDACLFGDYHQAKQISGKRRKVTAQVTGRPVHTAPVAVPVVIDPFASVPVPDSDTFGA